MLSRGKAMRNSGLGLKSLAWPSSCAAGARIAASARQEGGDHHGWE